VDVNAWQTQQHQKQKQTWMNRPPSSAGAPSPGSFVLHQNGGGGGGGGGGGELQHLFQVQASPQHGQRQVSGSNGVQRQQSLTNLRAKRSPKKEAPPGSRDSVDNQATLKRESLSQLHNNNIIGFGGEDVNSKPMTRHSIHGLNNSNSVKSPGNATYNKYTDEPPIQLRQLAASGAVSPTGNERRLLEDLTNQPPQQLMQQPMSPTRLQQSSNNAEAAKNKALVIGADSTNLDPVSARNWVRKCNQN